MIGRIASLAAALLLAGCATTLPESGERIPLWPNGAPGTIADARPEVLEQRAPLGTIVRNVTEPSLQAFLPAPGTATGAAMIVAPGGGFHMLSIENEGTQVAQWLAERGVAAFVLRYRLIPTGEDIMFTLMRRVRDRDAMEAALAPIRPLAAADGAQAVRWVRQNARRFGVATDRVGLMGFSAGGAVTVWTLTNGDPATRPDFAAAIYPGLLPETIAPPADAPPLFVLAAEDDAIAIGDSRRLAAAWPDAELVTYPSGGHGFGMTTKDAPTDAWTARFAEWLRGEGVIE